MDRLYHWFFNQTQESFVSDLPTNNEIKRYLETAETQKLKGQFYDSWDNESYAYNLILAQLFREGRIDDANEFAKTTNLTQEMADYIELEERVENEKNEKEWREAETDDQYYYDLIMYGEDVAKENKRSTLLANRKEEASSDAIINQYNETIQRLNIEVAERKRIEEQRAKEKIKQDALDKLRAEQEVIRKAAAAQAKINAPVDTSMNIYMRNKIRSDTANEINESTQTIYKYDVVYLFFKLLLFFILGGVFYSLMKDQNPKEMVEQIKETTKAVSKVVTEKVTDTVKSLKESVKVKGNVLSNT